MKHERLNPATDAVQAFSRLSRNAEYLDAETEFGLATAWRDQRDERALHRLVTAHIRLAGKTATRYRNYGLPVEDLVQEGAIGLMKAAEKFDPDRGYRFSTYAVFWIKAQIQEYVLRNQSVVRLGTTGAQKSLFFNLKRLQTQIARDAVAEGKPLGPEAIRLKIADKLGVTANDVEMMEGRLSGGDRSLNAPLSMGDEGPGVEWIDGLEDDSPQAAERVEAAHDIETVRQWLSKAVGTLSERERLVIQDRKLRDEPRTLESLGDELGVSKERVRQIEVIALGKMKKALRPHAEELADFTM